MKQKLIKKKKKKRCLVYLKSKVNICVITFMIVSIEIKNPPIETKNTVIFSRTDLKPVGVGVSVLNNLILSFLKSVFIKIIKSSNLDEKYKQLIKAKNNAKIILNIFLFVICNK